MTWEWQRTLGLFRTLSRTCRSLRAFVQPYLWEIVQFETVDELGKLAEALRAEPHLGAYIRHFKFSWWMNVDSRYCEPYPKEHGTLLDMAFIDRGELWDRARQEFGGLLRGNRAEGWYFDHDGTRYNQPGMESELVLGKFKDDQPTSMEPEDVESLAINKERSGPDGLGEDARIKSAKDFDDVFSEVAAQLTSVQSFQWQSRVTPMPVGVFEALRTAKHLAAFHFNLAVNRGNHCFGKHSICLLFLSVLF